MARNEWKDRARKEFDDWAGEYDKSVLQKYLFAPAHNALLDEVASDGKKRLLDIGCGTGVFAKRATELIDGIHVQGLDISEEMIRVAEEKATDDGRLLFTVGDSEHLPFDDNTFDAVTCSNSFHHYPRPTVVLKEFHRVLAPDGHVMIVDGRVNDPWGWCVFQVGVRFYEGWQVWHPSQKYFSRLLCDADFDPVIFRNVPVRWPFPLPLVLVKGRAQK